MAGRSLVVGTFTLLSGVVGVVYLMADDPAASDKRAQARANHEQGNFRDAYEAFRELTLSEDNSDELLADDYRRAVECLEQLQRHADIDDYREEVVAVQADDWRLLRQAALSLMRGVHYGFLVAGEFERGDQRGGGDWAQSDERDRVRALQLLEQARPIAEEQAQGEALAEFFEHYGEALLMMRDSYQAWRLQELTDLSVLPDYSVGYGYGWGWGWGSGPQGAPVDANGDPVLHHIPEAFAAAVSDGERWRYCLEAVKEHNPAKISQVDLQWANFLHGQFGVQTMQNWGIVLPRAEDADGDLDENSGPFAVSSLDETETIAKLATGVKRFTLPDEFNPIRVFQRVADGNDAHAQTALDQLAQIFEDRQQYPKAADHWQQGIDRFGGDHRPQRLQQIVGNWGRFEQTVTQPAGSGATLNYRFRNGSHVDFEARALKIDQLLFDVKDYLTNRPNQIDWNRLQIDNIGYQIVWENQDKYVGDKVAEWSLDLEPRDEHLDRRVEVATPLQDAGAYLVTATMPDGNISRIIVWLDDTVIARKQLDGAMWYYVADAVTGQPIERANVEFFGWKVEYPNPSLPNDFRIVTKDFAEFTDAEGQITLAPQDHPDDLQWLTIARTDDGRLAHMGFHGVWFSDYYDQEYNQVKVYAITDRPVYRPEQTAEYKFWVGQSQYDAEEQDRANPYANISLTLTIQDPQYTEIFRGQVTTDEFGGIAGNYALPADAMLGVYTMSLTDNVTIYGSGSFRVEEYKKPEFEVTVEAPTEPVMLGETITATLHADYYFGASVTQATVHYKVERLTYSERWFPVGRWDWLYGPGYWWFAPEYDWYPGWNRWGCLPPIPQWRGWSNESPELVMDVEVPIGPDGTIAIEIDTALAKELHGDQDHEYRITAEVTDASRRTIVGTGSVMVAREPFKVFGWTDRGYYQVGDTIHASFQARTLDGKGVTGEGKLTLYQVTYANDGTPNEQVSQEWDLNPDSEGLAEQVIDAAEAGQYRLSYVLADAEGHTIEGGHLFTIRGAGFDGSEFLFGDLELIPDKQEYAPGDTVNLMINTNRVGSTVLLFVRPSNGIYLAPEVLHLDGKSTVHEIGVVQKDMPNFFIEAITIADGELHQVLREIVVPPSERVLNVAIVPSAEEYLPGEEATVEVTVTDEEGQPFQGSLVLAIYDRAVEYISGGSNVGDIREFFWKWRRSHYPQTYHSLQRYFDQLFKQNEIAMSDLGVFGGNVADDDRPGALARGGQNRNNAMEFQRAATDGLAGGFGAPQAAMADAAAAPGGEGGGAGGPALVEPTVRQEFADTAFWDAAITTNNDGVATVSLNMPENLTDWKVRSWAFGDGTRVGEASTSVVTTKNIIIRLQAPRFFTETDTVTLSAVVHNYLEEAKDVEVSLELDGNCLLPLGAINGQIVTIEAGGEARVDWPVSVVREGEAVVRVLARTDIESDAMQMSFPVYVHGMLKTESFTGVVRLDDDSQSIDLIVPEERRLEESRLEIRYSPSLAGAMVDALPYLVEYPYGCTEQTLNRFLPTVITQNILIRMNLDLAAIQEQRTNLNSQENEVPEGERRSWEGIDANPVFDQAEVARMVRQGVNDLTAMQLSDGGWGWFSAFGEHSTPHLTGLVVHGLQIAEQNDVALVPGMLDKGVQWLVRYQNEQVRLLQEGEKEEPKSPYRTQADNIDALVYMVLIDADQANEEMRRFLYRDRLELSLYGQSLFGLALQAQGGGEQLDTVMRNIDQFLAIDEENQTAFLDLPNDNSWWYWHGDSIEANAYYLKLLTRANPQDERAAGLVKYLLNNRRHGTYWNSTRDTAVCIEAMAEYLTASGEAEPNMTVEVWLDGEKIKEATITAENFFSFDNGIVLTGEQVTSGEHQLEVRRQGTGPVYFSAYLTNFTLEDHITAAGLEIKVDRAYYLLVPNEDATETVAGSSGQVVEQDVEKYDRVLLENLDGLTSGDLVEIELRIESKNDYEYVVFEDRKPSGFEPVDLRSGYTEGGLGAYVEYRDERVAFFMRTLDRGVHSVSYRMRAETPGTFSALPTTAFAMYAPELRGNSEEIKLEVSDAE